MMKKTFVSIFLFSFVLSNLQAQSLLKKVPSSASMVIKYAAENFKNNVPINKIDSYKFIKESLLKTLGVDSYTSIQSLGINLEADSYQYVTTDDSTYSLVTLLQLKNAPQFINTIAKVYLPYGKLDEAVQKNGYQFVRVQNNTYIGWTENMAVIVNPTTQYKERYSDYDKTEQTETVTIDTAATAVTEEPVTDAAVVYVKPKTSKKKPLAKNKYKAPITKYNSKNKTSIKKKNTAPKIEETIVEEAVAVEPEYSEYEKAENLRRELWYQQQEIAETKKLTTTAENIINNCFAETITSIENTQSYTKTVELAAHVSIWVNTDFLISQYQNLFYTGRFRNLRGTKPVAQKDVTDGYKSAMNIYFEKDKMRVEQKSYSDNVTITKMSKAIMNSKQNASMASLVNPNNIGYLSMSVNTEAMADYYYTMLKKYLVTNPYMNEYGDIINVYIDLMQILIDEKGVSDLMPGNYLFVLHDMKPKMVDYIDYTYDKEYNEKKVIKTKKELAPNFTFAMETKKEGFMQNIAKLPLKYAKKEKFNYADKGGYYQLSFDSTKYPVSNLYFLVKDGKAIVTTSKEVINNTLNNTGFELDAETKNSILNNNYSLQIDTKKIFELTGTIANTNSNKKIISFFKDNMGKIKSESVVKDDFLQSTTTVGITGNHTNSLEFIFNMMETMNNIIEEERKAETHKSD